MGQNGCILEKYASMFSLLIGEALLMPPSTPGG